MHKNQNKLAQRKRLAKVSAQRKCRGALEVDLASLLSIDHACHGCKKVVRSCCATYEVCVSAAEMGRIIRVLPEAARLCSHLETDAGFDNVFEEVEPGLFAIDTTEDGLCLFAFKSSNAVRCSLHAAASSLGLALEQVKPKACLLWPMIFSEGHEVLSLADDALSFSCNSRRRGRSRRLSSSLMEAITTVYGKEVETALQKEADKGSLRATLDRRNSGKKSKQD